MTDIQKPIVQGVILGTRKAGTTWLYENFKQNPALMVSKKVKESSFFTGTTGLSVSDYDNLLPSGETGYAIEVDTSVCYSDAAAGLIEDYNPQMHLFLIFCEPAAFLQSRFTHSQRKGELKQETPKDALLQNKWLQQELDYVRIAARFAKFTEAGQLTVLPYELLLDDPEAFHDRVLKGLGAPETGFKPSTERVNVARTSSMPIASVLFSNAAKFARKFGGHRLVNAVKSLGVHSKLEKKAAPVTSVSDELLSALHEVCPETVSFHEELVASIK